MCAALVESSALNKFCEKRNKNTNLHEAPPLFILAFSQRDDLIFLLFFLQLTLGALVFDVDTRVLVLTLHVHKELLGDVFAVVRSVLLKAGQTPRFVRRAPAGEEMLWSTASPAHAGLPFILLHVTALRQLLLRLLWVSGRRPGKVRPL